LRAGRRGGLPVAGRHALLRPLPGRQVGAQGDLSGLRGRGAAGPAELQGQRAACVPQPQFVRADCVPARRLAGRQQEVDGGRRGPPRSRAAWTRVRRPRSAAPAALGCGSGSSASAVAGRSSSAVYRPAGPAAGTGPQSPPSFHRPVYVPGTAVRAQRPGSGASCPASYLTADSGLAQARAISGSAACA
jgi:hypothetical protein